MKRELHVQRPVGKRQSEGRKGTTGARVGNTHSLLIKCILIPLYIENRLLTFSHLSVARGSFHSCHLVCFNNSLAATQRKGANCLISMALLLCDHETFFHRWPVSGCECSLS